MQDCMACMAIITCCTIVSNRCGSSDFTGQLNRRSTARCRHPATT
jgi:hypothetical protein